MGHIVSPFARPIRSPVVSPLGIRPSIFDFPLSLIGDGLEIFLRHDEAHVAENGGAISQVDDQSTQGRHATQATALRKPTLVELDGRGWGEYSGGQVMEIADTLATALDLANYTMWLVVEIDSASDAQAIFSVGGGSNGVAATADVEGANERELRYKGVGTASNGLIVEAARELWIIRRSGGQSSLLVNNVVAALDTPGMTFVAASGTSFLGSVTAAPLLPFFGRIGEVGAMSRAMTSDETSGLWAYAQPWYTIP